MDLADFFARQLAATIESFIWAIEQIPAARRLRAPPDTEWLGQWNTARHVFHMLHYEREITSVRSRA